MKNLVFICIVCILSFCSCQKDNPNDSTPLPVVHFSISPEKSLHPKSVTFITSTDNEQIFTWDFGDGKIYTGGSVAAHTYENYGSYLVTLKGKGGLAKETKSVELKKDYGCEDKGIAYIVVDNPSEKLYEFIVYQDGSFMTSWQGGIHSAAAIRPGYYTLEVRSLADSSLVDQKSMNLQVCDELIWSPL